MKKPVNNSDDGNDYVLKLPRQRNNNSNIRFESVNNLNEDNNIITTAKDLNYNENMPDKSYFGQREIKTSEYNISELKSKNTKT